MIRIIRLLVPALVLALALALHGSVGALAKTALAVVGASPAAAGPNQVGLVIDFGNNVVLTSCVKFVEA